MEEAIFHASGSNLGRKNPTTPTDILIAYLHDQGNPRMMMGRMIAGSKSTYRRKYPDNYVLFNANIVTEHGKVWWGDLDLTLDEQVLSSAAVHSQLDLYVLYEMDGRFENEGKPVSDLMNRARYIYKKDGTIINQRDIQGKLL